jgi:alkanesulfonate monooxygenase SsuD/methylene tetrahydromethanopterin reductase-like flavin-dependent oxidoreductase (luciferase family)
MRLGAEQLVARAQAAEAAGFVGVAGMDHLAPPRAANQPMFEAMATNAYLAGKTSQLTLSSLVLCDAFRHPAVLAQQAVTIDQLSGGRFELGIGWGSVPAELQQFGITTDGPAKRVRRLRETIQVLQALWSGEVVDHAGEFFTLTGAQQGAVPVDRIPLVIGGAGPRTMELVATYADWWNIHVGILDRFDEAREKAGNARVSLQHMIAFVPSEAEREQVTAQAMRRFGATGVFVGNAEEIVAFLGKLRDEQDVERLYTWFTDFAAPDTLAAFGETVIPALRSA